MERTRKGFWKNRREFGHNQLVASRSYKLLLAGSEQQHLASSNSFQFEATSQMQLLATSLFEASWYQLVVTNFQFQLLASRFQLVQASNKHQIQTSYQLLLASSCCTNQYRSQEKTERRRCGEGDRNDGQEIGCIEERKKQEDDNGRKKRKKQGTGRERKEKTYSRTKDKMTEEGRLQKSK